MSDNPEGVRFGVGASIDQASIDAAKAAIAGIGGAFAKTFDEIERSKALASAAKDFAAMAVSENDAAKAAIGLSEALKELNATDTEVAKTVSAFDKEAEALRKVEEAAKAAAAAEEEKAAASSAPTGDTSSDDSSGGGSGSGLLNRGVSQSLRRLGSGAGALGITPLRDAANAAADIEEIGRSLSILKTASSGIPDTISGITTALGLTKAATEASTAVTEGAALAEGVQAAATGGVAVASGGAAVGLGAMLIPLLPFAVIAAAAALALAAVAAAIHAAGQQARDTAAILEKQFAAQDKIDQDVVSGKTSDEEIKKASEIQQAQELALQRNAQAQADYNKALEANTALYGPVVAELKKGDPVFTALQKRIDDTAKSAKDLGLELGQVNAAIDSGAFDANDARDAAIKKHDAAEKAAKDAVQAQDKAARDAEQAASKQKAAQEKTQREAEQAAEKIKAAQEAITKAQENNANKQIDQARANAQKIDSINQGARDKTLDTETSYYRDTVKLAQDARNKETDTKVKNAQADVDAITATNRKLEDLRNEAISSEEEATNSRNFLQAAKVREGLEKSNKVAIEEASRGAEDRSIAEKRDEAQRYQDLTRARVERKTQLDNQITDNKTALDRQLRDERLHEKQQANDTQIAYARESAALQAHLVELGGITTAAYSQQAAQAQAALNGGSTQSGIQAQNAARGGISGPGPLTGRFGGLRPITASAPLSNITNHVQINANTANDVYTALNRLGYVPGG